MRHYEIVFMVHPDQSDQVLGMVERYTQQIKKTKGNVHRTEDWGRRQLAYTINNAHKAHYILMNIECDQTTLDEIEHNFRFNDAVLRHLIMRRGEAVTTPTGLQKRADTAEEPKPRREARGSDRKPSSTTDKKAAPVDKPSDEVVATEEAPSEPTAEVSEKISE